MPSPEVCPVCGEDVPPGSLACPECGADHNTGWRQDADTYDGVDLPGDSFDYDEFVRNEFGGRNRPAGIKMFWWIAAVVAAVVLAVALLAPR